MSSLEQQLFSAIQQLDTAKVEQLIAEGANVNYLDAQLGFPLTVLTDCLFHWWGDVLDAIDQNQPLSEQAKLEKLAPYQNIFEQLIAAGATPHVWDSEEFYGPLWDASSAFCLPLVQRLIELGVNPNTLDDEGFPILSSVCDLWFECDYDEVDWEQVPYPEQVTTLQFLRANGAKMRSELNKMTDE